MSSIIKKMKSFMKFFIRPGARVVFIYRLSHWCYKHKLIALSWVLDNLNHFLNGCEISGKEDVKKILIAEGREDLIDANNSPAV
jgi:serine O-acetyltransferase